MATRTHLALVLNGLVQNIDLSADQLVLDSVKIGGGAGTVLTKTILDNLVSLQNGSDISASLHHHDGRYFTESELGSSSASSGSDLIGDDDTYSNFNPSAATVKGALAGIDTALGSLSADSKQIKVSANDTTEGYLNGKLVAGTGISLTENNDGGNETLTVTSTITQYTDEMAQDAVTDALFDTATIGWTYDDNGNSITADVIQSGIDHGSISGLGDDDHTQYHNDARGDARYYQKTEFVTTATAGAPVKLDGAGKIAVAQLPSAIMTYEGVFDASGTPASPLLNGDGAANTGMVYRCSVAGTYDFGAGGITFGVGDYAIYNSSNVWEKSDSTDAVASVNGATGVVTVNAINELTGDITAGPASGSESKAATIANSAVTTTKIADSAVTTAKINDLAVTTGKLAATSVTAAKLGSDVAGSGLSGGNGSALAVSFSPMVKKSMTAGESFAANTSFLVRFAVDGETASRVYKATKANAAADGKFHAMGIVMSTSAVSAGDPIDVMIIGSHTLGSSDTAFNAADIGKAVWLGASGAFTVSTTFSSGEASYKVGVVEATDKIWISDKYLTGIN
jgi:hypothetical protein